MVAGFWKLVWEDSTQAGVSLILPIMSGSIKEIQIGSKSAYVHQGKNTRVGFVIGHGASGDANSGLLPQIAEEIAQEGITVIRYNASGQLKSRISTLEVTFAYLALTLVPNRQKTKNCCIVVLAVYGYIHICATKMIRIWSLTQRIFERYPKTFLVCTKSRVVYRHWLKSHPCRLNLEETKFWCCPLWFEMICISEHCLKRQKVGARALLTCSIFLLYHWHALEKGP